MRAAKDSAVRATDLDALSCRNSANARGYFTPVDPYVQLLVSAHETALPFTDGYTALSAGRALRSAFGAPKLPLINRGTYLRTAAVDRLVSLFIVENEACQVVSLGGGSDTRGFRVLKAHPQVCYTEIDFPESTRVKKVALSGLREIQQIVGLTTRNQDPPHENVHIKHGVPNPTTAPAQMPEIEVASRADLAAIDPEVHTRNYHLVALDLRDLPERGTAALSFLDPAAPTLVICECVLCYLAPKETERLLAFWSSAFSKVAVVVYDPMFLGDAFGEMMAHNLGRRGLHLDAFETFPDLPARKQLFEAFGFRARLTDCALLGGFGASCSAWLDAAERSRVELLEMVDEVEEIALLLRHYCVIYAEAGLLLQFVGKLPWEI